MIVFIIVESSSYICWYLCSSSDMCLSPHCEEYINKYPHHLTSSICVFNPMGPMLKLSLQIGEENLWEEICAQCGAHSSKTSLWTILHFCCPYSD